MDDSALWKSTLLRMKQQFLAMSDRDAATHYQRHMVLIHHHSDDYEPTRLYLQDYHHEREDGFSRCLTSDARPTHHRWVTQLRRESIGSPSDGVWHTSFLLGRRLEDGDLSAEPKMQLERHVELMTACSQAADALANAPGDPGLQLTGETLHYNSGESFWIHAVFSLGWHGAAGLPIHTEKETVLPHGKQSCQWDQRVWSAHREWMTNDPDGRGPLVKPEDFPEAMPGCWFSILRDFPNQSAYFIDWLLSQPRSGTDPAGATTQSHPAEPASCITFHGHLTYQVPGGPRFVVTDNESSVLQVFVDEPAMNGDSLTRKSGIERAGEVLRKLTTKHDGRLQPFITLPGGKGKGGYRVEVRRAQ